MKTRIPSRVLVVDDDEVSRRALSRALTKFGHDVETAADAVEAMARLRMGADLLVVDADMPAVDGFELARHVRSAEETAVLPILMVTGLDGTSHRVRAVDSGIDDFITKPWDLVTLHLRSESLLKSRAAVREIEQDRDALRSRVSRVERDLRSTLDDLAAARQRSHHAHMDAVEVLVHAAEYKDVDTAAHQSRMRWFADVIARTLGLAPGEVERIREAASMHDVGKIGIPDAILLKPSPLTEEERRIMQGHTVIGAHILTFAASETIATGQQVARSHHERWDGRGYPDGLAGEGIPLAARICSVADVFDAMTMERVYRPAHSNDTALEAVREGRGSWFDPQVVDAFLESYNEIEQIQTAHLEPSLAADPPHPHTQNTRTSVDAVGRDREGSRE